ncbi:uncharacterized protein LOC126316985 [Schistocerca gregaria]|uniref:uncharacterized protein LOC126316985 n=1 Tax=Schistocerca gregaria TaxID=7010 RepID=UPI00211F4305|nr:uncharacterized protein LOC126316985 [Schistocerca gregaria]
MLNTTFVSKVNISYAHAISSVLGFLRSFALDKDSFYLEDVVRLLTLWFKYGSSAEIEDIMRHSLESVHVDIWLPVVSLIIARIDFKILSVRRIILKLSLQLCRVHPQVLAFQIALAEKSQATQNRSMIEILKNQMRQEQDTQIERQIKKRARLMKDREKEIEDGTLEFSLCDQMGTWKTGSALDGRSEPRPNRGENQLKGKALSTERLASVQVFLDESKPGEGGLEVKRSHFDPEEPVNSYACYENLKHHSLLDEVSFLSEELIKMTIIGYEACYLALEKACWFYGCRNIKKMLQVLDSYYAGLACPAVTTIERGFRQQYAGILNKAWKECELYRKSQNENHITQAASLYTKVYNSISLQLKNLKNLNLSDVSPRLLETSSFNLAVPATYQAHQPIVTIERFCRAIKIIPSKRRPRKLKIKGSNGHVYNYLLKGHEDLRHDERIMQFLGQINQTLIRSRSKVRRREERRTYAMDASDVERLRETLRCGYSANGWFPPLSGTGSSDPERRSGLEEQSGGHGGQSVSAESRISYSCAAPTNRYFDGPLPVQTYKVVPLSPCVGLIGWVPHSDTLKQLIKEYRLHYAQNFTLDFEIEFLSNKTSNYSLLTKIQKLELFEEVLKKSDGKDLANLMWLKSSSSQIWLNRRIRYTKSLAVMSMVGYLLGLGDRHSDNIMINRYSGGVIHIDFGDCLEASALCKEPEKVQFRLTRMLVNAMGATGTDGIFESTCVHVLRILRENKNNLMTVLRAFLYDPLMNWILPKREKKLASDGECEGQTVEKSCQYKKCQERCHIDQEETDSENKNLSFSLARQGSLQVLNCSMFSALSQRDNLDRNNNSNNILPSEAPSDAPSDAEAPRPSLGRLAHLNSLYSSAPPLLRSSFEHIAPSDPVPDYSSTVYQQPPNLSQDHLGHTSLYSTSHSQLHHHYSLSQMQYDYISKSDQFYSLSNDYSSARSCPDKQDTFTLAESAADPYRLQEGYGERSLLAIHRVYEKLVGKDFADSSGVRPPGKKQATSVSFTFQVNQLIEQATSHENLCQCFPGWSPWW